jgi:hypothetical protein
MDSRRFWIDKGIDAGNAPFSSWDLDRCWGGSIDYSCRPTGFDASIFNAASISFIRARLGDLTVVCVEKTDPRTKRRRTPNQKSFIFYNINYEKMTKNVSIRLLEDNFSDNWLLELHMSVGP